RPGLIALHCAPEAELGLIDEFAPGLHLDRLHGRIALTIVLQRFGRTSELFRREKDHAPRRLESGHHLLRRIARGPRHSRKIPSYKGVSSCTSVSRAPTRVTSAGCAGLRMRVSTYTTFPAVTCAVQEPLRPDVSSVCKNRRWATPTPRRCNSSQRCCTTASPP